MEIQHFNTDNKGMFKAVEDDKEAGSMLYTWAGPDQFIINHTNVDPEFGGRGVGKELLLKLVDYARANHIKVIPLCPFAKKMFEKDESIRDVVK